MNGPIHGRGRRLFLLLAPLALAAIAVPAAPGGAAENVRVTPSDVADGLTTIQTIAGDVAAAGTHKEKATLLAEGIEPVWAKVEYTIKANDKASYEALEAAIESLEEAATAGDATKAASAAGALTSAVNFYVAKFPPGASADKKASNSPAAAVVPAERKAAGEGAGATEGRAAAEGPVPEQAAAPSERRAAAEGTAAGGTAEAGDASLARTGPMSAALAALGGAAFAVGGLAVIAGARRRTSPIA